MNIRISNLLSNIFIKDALLKQKSKIVKPLGYDINGWVRLFSYLYVLTKENNGLQMYTFLSR